MTYINYENQLDSQVVGETFMAGAKTNAAIARKLKIAAPNRPDYATDLAASTEALTAQKQVWHVLAAGEGGFTCLFGFDGMPALTAPQPTEAAAQASALHFLVVKNKSAVT